MRFITLALEGYGRFRERMVFEFDAGLTCVVGANESGKSTVLAALLDALYTLPTSTAQSVRERIHWGHPHGWTLELALELRGESIRIRKFHPVDEPRRRAEFVLEHNGETLSGEAARERWEQLRRVPLAVYRATACVAQRAVARIEKGDLKSLQQQLRESAVNTDLERILTALQTERRRVRQDIERAQNRLRETEQRLHAARQAEQQRHALRERLRQAQQEADALREQLERDERLLERWRALHEQRTTLERLRREADANQRHIEQLEQIERRLRDLESDLQRDFAAWQALPDDHKAQVDAAWVRYQDAVRRLSVLEREAQAQRGAQQASVGRARARVGYAIVGLALCAASVPLWGVAPALGAIALGLGLVALAVALLWRTRRDAEPDTLTPALDAARREAHSHWEQLTALLAQARLTVETHPANGAPDAHAHETLQRLQHALHRYSERWNALQQRLAEQKRLRDQRDALHHLAPDPKALRDRLRELALQIMGLEEQIRRNPLTQHDLPEREMLHLDERVQQERQRLDALREEQLRCEGALQNMPTHEPTDALELEHARALQRLEQLLHRARLLETAEQLLREANTRYLSDLRPRLKPRIEQHLPALTLGRYTQADLGDDLSLQVYHPEREATLPVQEDAAAWSAGVLDQLFFACRLGLADALADDLRLPLLLDDPFVYADPARYRAALELLMRVARETQVVLFTCRPLPEGDWGKVITLGGV
jgi:DNA repair exonuclease SbcCD ATPase subunit